MTDPSPVNSSTTLISWPKPERNLLKDQVVDLLRAQILSGKLPPGTPLVERELAEQLGVSRVPARDALMQLEAEGLVVSKPAGRSVIALTERDIDELYQVRMALEKLAARQAAANISPQNRQALARLVEQMRKAVENGDQTAYAGSDLEIHRLIWQQSGNAHLMRVLSRMIGPIFMLVSRHIYHYDWSETMHLHEDLADRIGAGDADAAEASMERHTENARQRSLRLYSQGLL
jgi:DNA-binding GntR family transcriptional regulator